MTILYKVMARKWSRVLALLSAGVLSGIAITLIWHAFFFFTNGVTPGGKPFRVYKLAMRPVYLVLVNNKTPDSVFSYLVSDGRLDMENSSQVHSIATLAMLNPDYEGSKISEDSAKHGPARKISRRGNHIVFEDFYHHSVEFEVGR